MRQAGFEEYEIAAGRCEVQFKVPEQGEPPLAQMRAGVSLVDVKEGIVKSCIFGLACSLIAVYEGYYATPTAEGVGQATTRTVVTSAVVVLFFDYSLRVFVGEHSGLTYC